MAESTASVNARQLNLDEEPPAGSGCLKLQFEAFPERGGDGLSPPFPAHGAGDKLSDVTSISFMGSEQWLENPSSRC